LLKNLYPADFEIVFYQNNVRFTKIIWALPKSCVARGGFGMPAFRVELHIEAGKKTQGKRLRE
jgi:hypothetical protein